MGRLDKETSGLLILTDDHRLGEALTNPESHVPKTYEVVVDREPDESQMAILREGVNIGRGETTRPAGVEIVIPDTSADHRTTLKIVIDEGKNRQIRRMVAAVGLSVVSLTRVGVGAFLLGAIPVGRFVTLSPRDILLLKSLAKRAL